MTFQRFLLILFAIVAGPLLSVAQIYTFKNFKYEEGVNLVSILSVEECDNGYIWFGTDGAGLMRYDGTTFDYLEEIQGRNNRHVSGIDYFEKEILFTTLYRGVYSLKGKKVNHLSYIKHIGRNHAVFSFNNQLVVLQDSGLKVYKDSMLIQEKTKFPINPQVQYYGYHKSDEELFVFSSDMNYYVKGSTISSLHNWLNLDEKEVHNIVVAYRKEGTLIFVDKYLKNSLILTLGSDSQKNITKKENSDDILVSGEYVIKWYKRNHHIAYLTNNGRVILYNIQSSQYQVITNNPSLYIVNPTNVLIDKNSDIWVTTYANGAYRISLEPFTNLINHDLFKNTHIAFVAEKKDGGLLLSIANKGTFVGRGTDQNTYVANDGIYLTSLTYLRDTLLVSTKSGVFYVDDSRLVDYAPLSDLKGERVSLIFNAFGYLWYSVESKGLYRKDLKTGKTQGFATAPAYFYNAISTSDSLALYFGTNYGIQKYERKSDKLTPVNQNVDGAYMGSYVGNSVVDAHGTIWFSFDKGLMGITKNNKKVSITEEDLLPSLLIYTLNSDRLGHLIVGSNKGVTVIDVNENGHALSSKTFNAKNGFYGHETHMRSSYQSPDGSILLGTLGGLVLIRPEYFDRKTNLNRPVIFSLRNKYAENLVGLEEAIVFDSENNSILIEFKSLNTKSNHVSYSYRLEGPEDNWEMWSEWSTMREAIFNNLRAGTYTFFVKASIGGAIESEERSISFEISIPFYKNKWFIIIVISIVVLINISFLDSTSNFNRENIIISRDVVANKSMALNILAFGAITNTLGHIFASRIDDSIQFHDFSAIAVGLVLVALYLIIIFDKNAFKNTGTYLVIGFLVLLGYNLLFTYLSDIHPFYFSATLLVTFVAPYTLKRLRSAVFVSIALGVFAVVTMYLVDEAKYNQYLFLMGIAIACFLMIFKTYMRNNSLEQLIFTSGIVNKGNALVVAFDKNGEISFASENIEALLGINTPLKGESVLFLNKYQPSYNAMKSFNVDHLISEFKEGAIFVTPLITEKDEVVYYQWSCKQFSDEVRVILGQDVTEKINLENYYELIVKNADDLIFQTDTKGNFTFVNEKCSEVFGRSKNDLLDLSILNVVDLFHQNKVRDFFESNLMERNKGGYMEFPIITPVGGKKWLGLNLTTMRKPGAENVITGFLGLARDITNTRKANTIIKEQNKDITDSINYARRIQFNMLPRSSDFENLFDQHFILYKPKDIVSGDFFWLNVVDGKTILILSDCTGHGVPGSFMTLLGINILNEVIIEAKITDPGRILNELDTRLTEVLPRDGQNRIHDGMEVVVCVFDNSINEVEYALAGGRFLIKDNKEETIEVIKGETKHIGDEPLSENFTYETLKVSLPEDHVLYLFTDGYPDQFGGIKNKKLTIKKFLALIDVISYQEMSEQNIILQEYLTEWIGDSSQTDDITVIGIKSKGKLK